MTECSICFESVGDTNIVITECNHTFHLSCYKHWTKDSCPMCRTVAIKSKDLLPEILKHLSEEDVVNKEDLLIYISNYLEHNIDNIQGIYKGLIMYFIKLYLDGLDKYSIIDYILSKKMHVLLPYYDTTTDDAQSALINQDNVDLVKYINFKHDTLVTIVKQGSINLLRHYRDKINNDLYSYKPYTIALKRFNLLGIACMTGNVEIVEYLYETGIFDINESNEWNCTPIFAAICSGELKMVKWLVNKGVDINVKHVCDSTPLYFAIEKKYFDIAHYLINKGAIVDFKIVRACVNFTTDYKKGWKMLERVLKLVPKKDLYKPISSFCCDSNIQHQEYNNCEAHIHEKSNCCCFCKDCRYATNGCSGIQWTFLQGACHRKKLYTILLLLSYDYNLVDQSQEVCIHLDKHLQSDDYKSKVTEYPMFKYKTLKECIFSEIENISETHVCELYSWKCMFSCKWKQTKKLKLACEYIYSLIEKRQHVSWKHQRKILDKLMKDVNVLHIL